MEFNQYICNLLIYNLKNALFPLGVGGTGGEGGFSTVELGGTGGKGFYISNKVIKKNF